MNDLTIQVFVYGMMLYLAIGFIELIRNMYTCFSDATQAMSGIVKKAIDDEGKK